MSSGVLFYVIAGGGLMQVILFWDDVYLDVFILDTHEILKLLRFSSIFFSQDMFIVCYMHVSELWGPVLQQLWTVNWYEKCHLNFEVQSCSIRKQWTDMRSDIWSEEMGDGL